MDDHTDEFDHADCAATALRQAQAEWASEYDRVTRERPKSTKIRAALRMASQLAGERADALSTPPEGGVSQ